MKSLPLVRMFTGDKMVSSTLMNRLGAQVLRTVAARALYHARSARVDAGQRQALESLDKDGMLLIRDFLPAEDFQALRTQCLEALETEDPSKFVVKHPGPNTYEVLKLADLDPAAYPALSAYPRNSRLTEIMSAAEKMPESAFARGHIAIERLTQGPIGPDEDPETDLHSDIFFNTHKSWLYLDDVTLDHGPLAFVRGSHQLSATQLRFVYDHSRAWKKGDNMSRRISQDELDRLGMEETVVTVPRNTLVIANTCGYHRRLRGKPGMVRRALHVSLRANPFRFRSM